MVTADGGNRGIVDRAWNRVEKNVQNHQQDDPSNRNTSLFWLTIHGNTSFHAWHAFLLIRSILQRDPLDPKYNNDEGYKNSDKNAWKIPELPVPSRFPGGESRAESIRRSLARFPSNKTDGDVNQWAKMGSGNRPSARRVAYNQQFVSDLGKLTLKGLFGKETP